ncbi:MAG: hypothetical protein U5O39_13655 [Gammaproteobacteria bacterium]|nr:hypothetical protein [Gammaproteobacteria bacterium]
MRQIILLIIFSLAATNAAFAANASSERAIEIIEAMEDLYRGESSKGVVTMSIETPRYERTLGDDDEEHG